MRFDLENLPSDTALLHRLVHEMASVVESRDGEIERLQSIIKKLQRAQFGRRSERLDADQLALALEDLDTDLAAAEADYADARAAFVAVKESIFASASAWSCSRFATRSAMAGMFVPLVWV